MKSMTTGFDLQPSLTDAMDLTNFKFILPRQDECFLLDQDLQAISNLDWSQSSPSTRGSQNLTQVIRFVPSCSYLLSHLACPTVSFKLQWGKDTDQCLSRKKYLLHKGSGKVSRTPLVVVTVVLLVKVLPDRFPCHNQFVNERNDMNSYPISNNAYPQ